MPKLKNFSGTDILKILSYFGFSLVAQRGSHMKIVRILHTGIKQTLTVPDHKSLKKGMVHNIFKQSCEYIPEEELRKYFYTE